MGQTPSPMAPEPLVWLDELVEPEELPAEFAFRIAVVREAKTLAMIHGDSHFLKDEEVDLVLAKPLGFHAELLPSLETRAILPCARCRKSPDSSEEADRSGRPFRIDGARFGIEGKICKACYDSLFKVQAREARRS